MVCPSCGASELTLITCREASPSTTHILSIRLDDGFRRTCICLFFRGRVAFSEVRTLHVCVRCLDLVELLVKCPTFVSCQFFLVLCPVCASLVKTGRSGQPFAASSFAHDITSAIRFLKISDSALWRSKIPFARMLMISGVGSSREFPSAFVCLTTAFESVTVSH